MAQSQFGGLGGPINYYDMIPDFRKEALQETQNRLGQAQVTAQEMQNQQARQKEMNDQRFAADLQATGGDAKKLSALALSHPKYIDQIKNTFGMNSAVKAQNALDASNSLDLGLAAGTPEAIADAITKHQDFYSEHGINPQDVLHSALTNPDSVRGVSTAVKAGALNAKEQFDVQQKDAQLKESIRQADMDNSRGWGQIAVSRENSIRSTNGQGSMPANVREYEYVKNLSPEDKKEYLRLTNKKVGGQLQPAQLSSGETVMIDPAPLGAGSTKFYKGYDASGNVITVPVSSLSTSADSSTTATQGLVNSDIGNILNATPEQRNALTGITGGTGEQTLGADVRTRYGDKDTRKIYNSAQRLQGYMQNQGVGAAKSMGASGINTVAEAKMYFQSMPQLDFSSDDALTSSVKSIDDYTKAFNQKTKVNYGNQGQTQQQQPAGGSYTSKSGIQYTVK